MNLIPNRLCRCVLKHHLNGKSPVSLIPVRQANTILGWLIDKHRKSELSHNPEKEEKDDDTTFMVPRDYRYVYPDFLPSTNWKHRDRIREILERKDMYRRRTVMEIPEFYVGSILAVTVADLYAPNKNSRFVGICISREMNGLRSSFILRNHIDGNGVEIKYELYNPLLQNIEILRLEKRLDEELFYLRDCPAEYSTIPFDMEPVILPKGSDVPLNIVKVPLGPRPWEKKWDREDVVGLQPFTRYINKKEAKRIERSAKPWEKYDLMKKYRESLTEEETEQVMKEVMINKQQIDKERDSKKTRVRKQDRE